MGQQDRYIPGVPCWVDTAQPDPQAAVRFYAGLFGWTFEEVVPPGEAGEYHIARLGGGDVAAVGSVPAGSPPEAAWNTYVWVEDADETAAKARTAGGQVLTQPFDVGESGRMAVCADSEGAVFCVWQPREHRGAQVVNEHASLNFNDLHTQDLDAAAAFYGAVFGWEVLDAGGSPMWALPGYGDFLERRTPGTRAKMAELGAPERFEDVVAGIVTIEDGDARPHWGVVFAVDDADAIAERATQLGGRVDVAPFDAPWTRMTVVTDPQGATFTASTFVPENKDLAPDASASAA